MVSLATKSRDERRMDIHDPVGVIGRYLNQVQESCQHNKISLVVSAIIKKGFAETANIFKLFAIHNLVGNTC